MKKTPAQLISAGPIVRHLGNVTPEQRKSQLGQRPITVWLTGLSGAGKSTLAYALEQKLIASARAVAVLDGDNVRHGLSRDLGFSAQHRQENIRRIAEVARLMNDAGLVVITSFISPYQDDRAMARRVIGEDAFFEIYLNTPLRVCETRDPKGLYVSARDGQIEDFTGVSAPYEPPIAADLILDTSQNTLVQCVDMALNRIAPLCALLPTAQEQRPDLRVAQS